MIDIIGITTDGVHIAYGNGRNDFEIRGGTTLKLADQFRVSEFYGNYWHYPIQVADVDGDGLGDIIGFSSDTSSKVQIAFQETDGTYTLLNNATGDYHFSQGWNKINPRFVTDLNNDGKADIIGFANANALTYLSKGRTFDEDGWFRHENSK